MTMLDSTGETAPPASKNDVAEAARRLDEALARLESLVEHRTAGQTDLRAALAQAQEENAELKALLEKLAGRVDAAVGRLEEVLKE